MSLAQPRVGPLTANSEYNLRATLRDTEEYYACQPKRQVPEEAEQLMAWMNLTKYPTEQKIKMIQDVIRVAEFKFSAYEKLNDTPSANVYKTLYRRAEAMRDAAEADLSTHYANAREIMRLHHPHLESRLHPNWPQMVLRQKR